MAYKMSQAFLRYVGHSFSCQMICALLHCMFVCHFHDDHLGSETTAIFIPWVEVVYLFMEIETSIFQD